MCYMNHEISALTHISCFLLYLKIVYSLFGIILWNVVNEFYISLLFLSLQNNLIC